MIGLIIKTLEHIFSSQSLDNLKPFHTLLWFREPNFQMTPWLLLLENLTMKDSCQIRLTSLLELVSVSKTRSSLKLKLICLVYLISPTVVTKLWLNSQMEISIITVFSTLMQMDWICKREFWTTDQHGMSRITTMEAQSMLLLISTLSPLQSNSEMKPNRKLSQLWMIDLRQVPLSKMVKCNSCKTGDFLPMTAEELVRVWIKWIVNSTESESRQHTSWSWRWMVLPQAKDIFSKWLKSHLRSSMVSKCSKLRVEPSNQILVHLSKKQELSTQSNWWLSQPGKISWSSGLRTLTKPTKLYRLILIK